MVRHFAFVFSFLMIAGALPAVENRPPPDTGMDMSVTPLDPATRKLLENSSLNSYVQDGNQEQIQFRQLSFLAAQKVARILKIKNQVPIEFVYDCLFLTESGFDRRYVSFPKSQLDQARQAVLETFKR